MRTHYTLPRLYLPDELTAGSIIDLSLAQTHFLTKVLRQRVGGHVRVFNETGGEWRAEITTLEKRSASIKVLEPLRPPHKCPDIWLLFAPVKKDRTQFITEKATELGVSKIQPVITARTTGPNIRMDKMQAHIVEAAEQTERLDLPTCSQPVALDDILETWPAERALIFADEAGNAESAPKALAQTPSPAAILIGPEGGFTPEERAQIRSYDFTVPISLGPRILRAETAVAATVAIWQSLSGDW